LKHQDFAQTKWDRQELRPYKVQLKAKGQFGIAESSVLNLSSKYSQKQREF